MEAFNFHVDGSLRALAAGNSQGSAALLRQALSIANRMQDGQRIGLCLRILKWMKAGVRL